MEPDKQNKTSREEQYEIRLRVPSSLSEKFKQIAEEDNRSFNGEVLWMMKYLIAIREGKETKERKHLQLEDVLGSIQPVDPSLDIDAIEKMAREDRIDYLTKKYQAS